MKELLFIDCLIRKSDSRTLVLANEFLNNIDKSKYHVNHLVLSNEELNYLTYEKLNKRQELLDNNNFDDPMFKLANEFSKADLIVIAAPYWDLSFPALLKVYFENICVCGITFKYDSQGPVGLCKAEQLVYITTSGGYFINTKLDNASSYIFSIAEFLGIQKTEVIAAEGLDIFGNDVPKIMNNALFKVKELTKNL